METTSVVSSAASAAASVQTRAGDAVAITMLRKAMDNQAQNAAQLIDAVAQPAKPAPVGSLGHNVNTFA